MQVSFTKVDAKRYLVAIDREHGPPLVPRPGPGYDDLMPHDLAHYLVEEEYGDRAGCLGPARCRRLWHLPAGSRGRLGAGAAYRRADRVRRPARHGTVGAARVLSMATWERTVGRNRHQGRDMEAALEPEQLEAAVRRLDRESRRWRKLPFGAALTYTWPSRLTFNAAASHRGRRNARDVVSRRISARS